MITDYTVIECKTKEDLAQAIRTYSKVGWSLQGGASVSYGPGFTMYTQAMVKSYEEKTKSA